MPPDINTGPMALAAGTPPKPASGPPGGDPLAAMFAAFLAQSGGPPLADAASAVPKVGLKAALPTKADGKTAAPAKDKAADKTAEDATGQTAQNTALPPLLPIPIQMRPFLPPIAGVTAEQKTTEKTMDTTPVPASPQKDKASVKPGGELPLQEAAAGQPGPSALFPAFLLPAPTSPAPAISPPSVTAAPSAGSTAAAPVAVAPVAVPATAVPATAAPAAGATAAAHLTSAPSAVATLAAPSAALNTASIGVQGLSAVMSPLAAGVNSVGQTSVALPKVFVLGAVASAAQPAAGSASLPTEDSPAPADGSPAKRSEVPSGIAPAGVLPQPDLASPVAPSQAFVVPADAVLMITKVPETRSVLTALPLRTPVTSDTATAGGAKPAASVALPDLSPTPTPATLAAAARMPEVPPGVVAQALPPPGAVVPLTPPLPLSLPPAASADAVLPAGLIVTDGLAAMDGNFTTDGSRTAMEGDSTTDGQAATDGKIATEGTKAADGKTLNSGETPEKTLKSAAVSADINTRSQAVPAKAQPTDLPLPVIGKRSERRAEDTEDGASPLLPTAGPAQAATAPVEAKPLTAADRAEVVRQAADAVGTLALPAKAGASDEMTLQLHPKDWGQLQISVRVVPGTDANAVRSVTAHIVAENPQVKAALENHSSDLRQALREAGLNLDRISVTVQSTDASAQAGTATSGGRHEAGQGGPSQGGPSQGGSGAFGETPPGQRTGMSSETGMSGAAGNGLPSFAASGGSHGGRQGGQPPPAYAAAYVQAEPEPVSEVSRRPRTGQVDIRA